MASLYDRIGVDIGRRMKLEDGIDWAAHNRVRHIDIQLDTGANAFTSFDDARARGVREALERHGIELGLHTLSAVNVAEYSPILSEAVDAYLKGYIDVCPKLGATWIVVHAGYHFTADAKMRMEAGLDRLKRMVDYAETRGAVLLLENLNKEPLNAEVHYLAHTIDEWRFFFETIDSPSFALSFTANHAHLLPGEGDLDFGDMFRRIEASGFAGHYMNAFGSLDDMQAARRYFVDKAGAAGVAV